MKEVFLLLRINQWTKNLICFSGVFFGDHILDVTLWILALKTFFIFSLISSSVYIFNDIIDKDSDSKHPKKKNRPIANGSISITSGIIIGILLLCLGLCGSLLLDISLFIILFTYLFNNILYSFYFKNIPVADVFCIAFGFILRLISGIYIINDSPTEWIILCTMFLALFLGFSKRRAELILLKNKNHFEQRPVLKKYNIALLDSLVNESSFGAVITYALFTITSGKNSSLVATIPIVYFGIIHYKMLLFDNKHGEEPDTVLLKDKVIWICILSWLILFSLIMYFKIDFFSY